MNQLDGKKKLRGPRSLVRKWRSQLSAILPNLRSRKIAASATNCSRWLGRLAEEISTSPLNQLTFFLAAVGVVLGVVSGWNQLVGFLGRAWQALSLAILVAIVAIKVSSRVAASRRREQGNTRTAAGRAALLKLLRGGALLTRSQATEFLKQVIGNEAEQVLNRLIGVCTSLPTTPHLVVGRSACRVGVGPSLNRSWAQRSRPVVQAGRRAFPGDESVVD